MEPLVLKKLFDSGTLPEVKVGWLDPAFSDKSPGSPGRRLGETGYVTGIVETAGRPVFVVSVGGGAFFYAEELEYIPPRDMPAVANDDCVQLQEVPIETLLRLRKEIAQKTGIIEALVQAGQRIILLAEADALLTRIGPYHNHHVERMIEREARRSLFGMSADEKRHRIEQLGRTEAIHYLERTLTGSPEWNRVLDGCRRLDISCQLKLPNIILNTLERHIPKPRYVLSAGSFDDMGYLDALMAGLAQEIRELPDSSTLLSTFSMSLPIRVEPTSKEVEALSGFKELREAHRERGIIAHIRVEDKFPNDYYPDGHPDDPGHEGDPWVPHLRIYKEAVEQPPEPPSPIGVTCVAVAVAILLLLVVTIL